MVVVIKTIRIAVPWSHITGRVGGKYQLCGGRDGRNAEWGGVAGGGCGTWPTSIWRVCRVVMSSKSFTSQDNKVKGKESCRLHGCCLHGCRTMIGYLNEKC